ncbi:DUF397 domain-containing protein [Streptomyces sp. KMM 9044]|uniref:DUF397 domain-containing protein n=1 Tax=Streptomyces sp. KMM 9044 TaxID=2744474 RepID=UPI003FA7EBEA
MAWRRSSYSGADTPSCIEVATVPDSILVRDSKNPDGPRLALAPTTRVKTFSPTCWTLAA